MPKRTFGPFSELAGMAPLNSEQFDDDIALTAMWKIHDLLHAVGLKPNGTENGNLRDVNWGADLSELVLRTLPFERLDNLGLSVKTRIDLRTIQCDVDSNMEICAWTYEYLE